MTNPIPGWTGTHRYPTGTSTTSPYTGENPFVEPGVHEDTDKTRMQLDIEELQEYAIELERKHNELRTLLDAWIHVFTL